MAEGQPRKPLAGPLSEPIALLVCASFKLREIAEVTHLCSSLTASVEMKTGESCAPQELAVGRDLATIPQRETCLQALEWEWASLQRTGGMLLCLDQGVLGYRSCGSAEERWCPAHLVKVNVSFFRLSYTGTEDVAYGGCLVIQ